MCIFIVGNIIQITAMNSWVHLMMGRFVAGLGVGNLSVGVPMFQSECSPREIRGAVVATYQLLITFGILVSNIINYGVRTIEDSSASWRIVIGLGIVFSLPLGIGILLVPESPRWLAARSDWEGARMAMARLRGLKDDPKHPLIERDLKEMYDSLETQNRVGVGSWLECFTGKSSGTPKVVYRTFLGMGIHFLQQVGIFCFGAQCSHVLLISRPSVDRRQLLLLLWSDHLRLGGGRRPHPDPAHPRRRQRLFDLLRSLRRREVWSSVAALPRRPVASSLACRLCLGRHSPQSREQPRGRNRHDRRCMHVHCLVCEVSCSCGVLFACVC